MIDWKDIESAPTDETWVLLYGDLHGEPHVQSGFWSEEGRSWFHSESASRSLTDFWKPTHWTEFNRP
jgi:hypothetical protein